MSSPPLPIPIPDLGRRYGPAPELAAVLAAIGEDLQDSAARGIVPGHAAAQHHGVTLSALAKALGAQP